MRNRASAFPAWMAALLAAATVVVLAWVVWPRSDPPQWPTVSDGQVARAVRSTGVTCRPVAFAWRCVVRYRDDRTATCNVGLRERPMVNREPRFTVIC